MKPCGDGCMQIVPPVMMINTFDSWIVSSGGLGTAGLEEDVSVALIVNVSER